MFYSYSRTIWGRQCGGYLKMTELKCPRHPDSGTHYGERTKVIRCNYCNDEVKQNEEKKK